MTIMSSWYIVELSLDQLRIQEICGNIQTRASFKELLHGISVSVPTVCPTNMDLRKYASGFANPHVYIYWLEKNLLLLLFKPPRMHSFRNIGPVRNRLRRLTFMYYVQKTSIN